jgi:beta-glucanase (GH16 family)
MNRMFFIAPLMFAVLLVLTISVRFSGHSLAKTATWTKVWSDEFNGPISSGVNRSNWLYDTGHGYGCSGCPANWGTSEVESMSDSPANVRQDGKGHLVIKAIRDASGNWTSGRIETQRTDFAAPPRGQLQIVASLEQPNVASAAGYWPAFWMLGAQFRGKYLNWPGIGEVDIMEDVNGLNGEFATLHCGVAPGGPCKEFTGISSGQSACARCQSAFHTYMVIIDRSVSPEQIRWYLDGVNIFKVSANQVPASIWSAAVDHAFFIIFNLSIGGAFPMALGGGPNPTTTSGGSLKVDYVRVYTTNGSVIPTSTTGRKSPATSPAIAGGRSKNIS